MPKNFSCGHSLDQHTCAMYPYNKGFMATGYKGFFGLATLAKVNISLDT